MVHTEIQIRHLIWYWCLHPRARRRRRSSSPVVVFSFGSFVRSLARCFGRARARARVRSIDEIDAPIDRRVASEKSSVVCVLSSSNDEALKQEVSEKQYTRSSSPFSEARASDRGGGSEAGVDLKARRTFDERMNRREEIFAPRRDRAAARASSRGRRGRSERRSRTRQVARRSKPRARTTSPPRVVRRRRDEIKSALSFHCRAAPRFRRLPFPPTRDSR